MTVYVFNLTGQVKPYVRMTSRGKFVSARAKEYLESQKALRWQLLSQMSAKGFTAFPERTPLSVELSFTVEKRQHCKDLDNETKAILDAASGIVYPDDRWIDRIHAERELGADPEVCLIVREL